MERNRLEAFSDGVLAIVITIMVLEIKTPHGTDWEAIRPLVGKLLSYVLSFAYIGIYWNNHHHLLQTVRQVSGGILWANLHLLFWLTLIPVANGWLSENGVARAPAVAYGTVLFCAAVAYKLLQEAILRSHGEDSVLARALGSDLKGKLSIYLYLVGVILAFWQPWLAIAAYAGVAVMWLVPDRRIERELAQG